MSYSWNSTFYIGESIKDRTMTIRNYSSQNGRTPLYITASKSSNMSDSMSIATFVENANISNDTYIIPAEYSYIKFLKSSVSGTPTAYMRDMYIK